MTKQQLSGGETRPGEQLHSFVGGRGGGEGVIQSVEVNQSRGLTYCLNVPVETPPHYQPCEVFAQLKANFLSLLGCLVRM